MSAEALVTVSNLLNRPGEPTADTVEAYGGHVFKY